MPPLALHVVVAKRIGEQLAHPTLDAALGSLYLGSTAPDICVLTRWPRQRTHFFDLARLDEQSGVAAMFQAYPSLAQPASLNVNTTAFVCGYITHLVMDECWISDIYRPFFGPSSPLAGDSRADIMDKVIQYDLDGQSRSDRRAVADILQELAAMPLEVEVGFIDRETIGRWRDLMVEAIDRLPDWQRFHYIGGRVLRAVGIDSPQAFDRFLKSLPDLLAEIMHYLGGERLQAFLDKSLDQGLAAVKEYLD